MATVIARSIHHPVPSADGGGLTDQGRAKREAVRMRAAQWFAQDMPVAQIAHRLRVSTNAVYV